MFGMYDPPNPSNPKSKSSFFRGARSRAKQSHQLQEHTPKPLEQHCTGQRHLPHHSDFQPIEEQRKLKLWKLSQELQPSCKSLLT